MNERGGENIMTFSEFFKDYMKEYDVWNMSLEEYNYHKRRAMEIYKRMTQS